MVNNKILLQTQSIMYKVKLKWYRVNNMEYFLYYNKKSFSISSDSSLVFVKLKKKTKNK